mmetsp:Transcript_48772/g.97301  ORF Transcript_48772/g.97301 Transcript_48772/m.97301 type:complete len:280 (-) Transcript_48772:219-1058(-)
MTSGVRDGAAPPKRPPRRRPHRRRPTTAGVTRFAQAAPPSSPTIAPRCAPPSLPPQQPPPRRQEEATAAVPPSLPLLPPLPRRPSPRTSLASRRGISSAQRPPSVRRASQLNLRPWPLSRAPQRRRRSARSALSNCGVRARWAAQIFRAMMVRAYRDHHPDRTLSLAESLAVSRPKPLCNHSQPQPTDTYGRVDGAGTRRGGEGLKRHQESDAERRLLRRLPLASWRELTRLFCLWQTHASPIQGTRGGCRAGGGQSDCHCRVINRRRWCWSAVALPEG